MDGRGGSCRIITGGLAWFLRNQAPDIHDMFIQIGPRVFWSTSPVFWVILGLGLAVLLGLVVGFIAINALGRMTSEKCEIA